MTPPLTIAAAAEALGISTKTVRRLIAQRKLGSIRYTPRGKVFVAAEELARFREACTTPPKLPKVIPPRRRLTTLSVPRSQWGTDGVEVSDILPRSQWGRKY